MSEVGKLRDILISKALDIRELHPDMDDVWDAIDTPAGVIDIHLLREEGGAMFGMFKVTAYPVQNIGGIAETDTSVWFDLGYID